MKQNRVLLLLGSFVIAGVVWQWMRGTEPNSPNEPPLTATAPTTSQTALGPPTNAAPGLPVTSAGLPERHLIRVQLQRDSAQSQAYIVHQGRIETYKLGQKVAPDNAVLVDIQAKYVQLKLDAGDMVTLSQEDMSDEDRELYTEAVSPAALREAEIKLPEPVKPEHRQELAENPDPYTSCEAEKGDDARQRCEDRIDEEIKRRSAVCSEAGNADTEIACMDRIRNEIAARPYPP